MGLKITFYAEIRYTSLKLFTCALLNAKLKHFLTENLIKVSHLRLPQPEVTTVRVFRVPPTLKLWVVLSPLNNPIETNKLYVLTMFIIRVLLWHHHVHSFYMMSLSACAGSLRLERRWPTKRKGFRSEFFRNPSRLNRPPLAVIRCSNIMNTIII